MMAIDSFGDLQKRVGRPVPEKDTPVPMVRTPLQWTQLATQEPPERIWVVDHWLSAGSTLLAGGGGIGKTLVAQTLATGLALGMNFLDAIRAPQKVLFWACEDDHDELWRRQVAICRFFGATLADLDGKLIIEPRLGKENTLFYAEFGAPKWTALYPELRAQVEDYKADVTFLDNLGQTFGGKENERHHVTAFMNGLSGLSSRPHAMVLLSHPAKQEGSEYSGSTAWENAVRMRWYMGARLPDHPADPDAQEDDPDVRYLCKRKSNYTVKDYRKLLYRNGVFEPEQQEAGFSQRYSAGRRQEVVQAVLVKGLDRLLEQNIRCTDGRTSPDYLPKKLIAMKLAQDCTQRELVEALNALRLAGKLIEAPVGFKANRQVQYGLKRAS